MRNFLLRSIPILFLSGLGLAACQESDEGLALGTLERDRIALTATAAEVIVGLPVKEGSDVEAGTVLVELDNTQQKAVVAQAEAEMRQAEASLEKSRNGSRKEEIAAGRAEVAGARATLVEAERNFQRSKELVGRGAVSKASYDSALANRNAAEASLQSAEEQLRQMVNGSRAEDLKAAEAAYEAAKANLASQQKVLEDLTVRASRKGRLDSLPWNLGERVTSGSPVAVLLAEGAPFARVYVPEPYRVRIRTGDTLAVRVDGLDKELSGTVRWISSDPSFTPYYALNQEERSRLMYPAEVQLPEDAADLPSGVPAQVVLPKAGHS